MIPLLMKTLSPPTPMMAQWQACKEKAPNALLLFRMGDFYEAFHDDAAILAKELDLTLTRRQEVPMSGVPHHSSSGYIDRLVAKGYRVAIAEQVEDPKASKGLVKREVVRIVTPGSLIDSSILCDKANNFFVAVTQVGSLYGLSVVDLTTSDLRAVEFGNVTELMNELYRLHPAECLMTERFHERHKALLDDLKKDHFFLITHQEEEPFGHQHACNFLIGHFEVATLDGFGLRGKIAAINAAGGLLYHLREGLRLSIGHIGEVTCYSTESYLSIDRTSQRNLELTEPLHGGSKSNTLVGVLDKTVTPMGGRLLHQWVQTPLLDIGEICLRQDGVQAFMQESRRFNEMRRLLGEIRDLERLIMRIDSGYAAPRDLVTLRFSFEILPALKQVFSFVASRSELVAEAVEKLKELPEMTGAIGKRLVDEPPARLSDGGLIREGFDAELDELREMSRNSKEWLSRYQTSLREETGIKNLKIGFNRMFGYYIEVSRGQLERIPTFFERRQTLVNGERFITSRLKEFESKLLTAEERIAAIEQRLFYELRELVGEYAGRVVSVSRALATLDVLFAFAQVAQKNRYCRPVVDESCQLSISCGRHPVIETIEQGESFVGNDVAMDGDEQRLILLTGPNMAGKSTYLRQVALTVIMAQMGAFVPAKSAQIGLVDRLFTRVGASDDLSRGQSTFMVEMAETAYILHHATDRSLVILDEIGRGTSTYDGISIAWSVAEYLLKTEGKKAKTLFATHYSELTQLQGRLKGVKNYRVAVHESEGSIRFLRKIVSGRADKSYGIHVAKLAGLPAPVVERAKEILEDLEQSAGKQPLFAPKRRRQGGEIGEQEYQLTFF